ncbi:hypothetical protein HDU67_001524, partial [Dinochytrium kinnereticum]
VVKDCSEGLGVAIGNRELTNIVDVRGLLKTLQAMREASTRMPAMNAFSNVDTVEQLFATQGKVPANMYFKAEGSRRRSLRE